MCGRQGMVSRTSGCIPGTTRGNIRAIVGRQAMARARDDPVAEGGPVLPIPVPDASDCVADGTVSHGRADQIDAGRRQGTVTASPDPSPGVPRGRGFVLQATGGVRWS